MEETVTVRPEKRLWGSAYAFLSGGREVGRFEMHALRPNEYTTGERTLTFDTVGLVLPRFTALEGAEEVAALDVNPWSGGITLIRGRERVPVRREGLLLPTLVAEPAGAGGGAPVLEVASEGPLGRLFTATLRPTDAWPRGDLEAALALIFHAKASVRVAWAMTGAHPAYAPV